MEPSEEELRRRLRAARDESRARSKPSVNHYTDRASWGDVAADAAADAVASAYGWLKTALLVAVIVLVVVVKITSS